jgi:hypothetical protein
MSQPEGHKVDSILRLLKNENSTDKKAIYLLSLSELYNTTDKIKSLMFAKEAMDYAYASKFDTLKIRCLARLAGNYLETDDLAKASKYYKMQLELERKLNDLTGQAYTNFNLSLLYNDIDDPVNSLKYLRKSSALIKQTDIKDNFLLFSIKLVTAGNWYKLNNLDSAKSYYNNQAVLKALMDNQLDGILISYHYDAAKFYLKIKDYDNCKARLNLMHSAELQYNNYELESYRLILLSQLNLILGKIVLAEKNALESVTLAKENGSKESAQLAYGIISEIKEKQLKPDSAFYYYKLSRVYEDSLKGSTIKNLLQLENIEIEEYESAILESKLNDLQKTILFLIAGVIMLGVLLGVTYLFFKRQQKLKRTIELKNKEIIKQNLKLIAQTGEMISLIDKMEHLLKERSLQLNNYAFYLSQRLRAPIARIVGLGKLGKTSIEPTEKLYITTKICEVTEQLDAMSKEGQRLLDNDQPLT